MSTNLPAIVQAQAQCTCIQSDVVCPVHGEPNKERSARLELGVTDVNEIVMALAAQAKRFWRGSAMEDSEAVRDWSRRRAREIDAVTVRVNMGWMRATRERL